MITVNSDTPYLGIPFAELLDFDIIQNLKEGFGMLGMRFTGKPTKAGIVKAYDEYVKASPADVLRCLILKQGRSGVIKRERSFVGNKRLVLTRRGCESERFGAVL